MVLEITDCPAALSGKSAKMAASVRAKFISTCLAQILSFSTLGNGTAGTYTIDDLSRRKILPAGAGKANNSARGTCSGVAEPREGQHGQDEPEGCRGSENGCPHENPCEGMVSCLVWCYAHERGGKACVNTRGITPRNGVNTLFPQFCIRWSGCFGMVELEGSEFWSTNNNIRSRRCRFPWSFPRGMPRV